MGALTEKVAKQLFKRLYFWTPNFYQVEYGRCRGCKGVLTTKYSLTKNNDKAFIFTFEEYENQIRLIHSIAQFPPSYSYKCRIIEIKCFDPITLEEFNPITLEKVENQHK